MSNKNIILFKIDLQLFSQEKTEKATPKKRQEARKKGQVAKSKEINTALILLLIFLVLRFIIPYLVRDFMSFTENFLVSSLSQENLFTNQEIINMYQSALISYIRFMYPILLTAIVVGVISNYIQIGFLFTTESMKFKPERLNPIEGLKRIFSKKGLAELIKSLFKIALISYIIYFTIREEIMNIPLLADTEIIIAVRYISNLVFNVVIQVSLVLLVLSVFDYIYQKWEFEQSIKMSKQDIKEEFKQTEGNPQIKSKVRQIQKEMAMKRMMQDVPKADVVITNPHHLAVAIQYDVEISEAPFVIAKGANIIAEKIKEIAKNNNKPIIENKPIAQALYKTVEIGEIIPEDLYQAVAEILAFVYSLDNEKRRV